MLPRAMQFLLSHVLLLGCCYAASLLNGVLGFYIWLLIRCIDGFNSCCSPPLLPLSRAVIAGLSLAGSGILGAPTRKQRDVGKKSWEDRRSPQVFLGGDKTPGAVDLETGAQN